MKQLTIRFVGLLEVLGQDLCEETLLFALRGK